MSHSSEEIVEHLFRSEYGKLVAILTGIFGTSNIQLAEDIVQETLISALNHWGEKGVPENPTGWLVQVAKRKVLNVLKRDSMRQNHHKILFLEHGLNSAEEQVFLENEIKDSQLRMIFTCCHSDLSTESKIALTLKTLCGFGVKEVAGALLTTESTINKRLYRAKKTIRESKVPFDIPNGEHLTERVEVVLLTLYLLYNEGYNASGNYTIIRKELCLEAIRLVKLLADQFPGYKNINALLALMCFHSARFEARIDDHGAIVLFEDQDRNLWNLDLIQEGMRHLNSAMGGDSLSAYHIEAGIAAEHCLAQSFETTNWDSIKRHYTLLYELKPTPVIKLNLAIIESQLSGYETSVNLLDELSDDKALKGYHLLPATQGAFNVKLKHYQAAIGYFEKAKKMQPSATELAYIDQQIEFCKNNLPEI